MWELLNVITHNVIWANQKTQSFVLHWLRAHAMFDIPVFTRALDVISGLQRQLSYMKPDGSFKMFRDDENSTSTWLSAFVAKTLHEARFGEWERDLFIPIDLIDKIVVWLCSKQNDTGAWYPEDLIYDRKFVSRQGSYHSKITFMSGFFF